MTFCASAASLSSADGGGMSGMETTILQAHPSLPCTSGALRLPRQGGTPNHTMTSIPDAAISTDPSGSTKTPADPLPIQKNLLNDIRTMKTSIFKQYFRIFLLPVGLIIIALLIAYLFLNAPALLKRFNYYYKTEVKKENFADNNFVLPSINPSQTNQPGSGQSALGNLEDNHLYIPSLNINAPIIWAIPEDEILENLKNGVVQFNGSDTPDGPGNVFITGHSSYYWWVKSDYKHVFALLPNIKKDDQIIVTYKGEAYIYKVTDTLTVKPSQTDIIDSRGKREVTLMTCVPVGTNISRFIVKAELQNKNATERSVPNNNESFKLLPKVN